MKKIFALLLTLCCIFGLVGCNNAAKESTDTVNRVIGYSALYSEELIVEAFDIVENEFSTEFEGYVLTELRYDNEVENEFASEIERYAKENNQELIVILSSFETDDNSGDEILNSDDTYSEWEWRLVRTADKKSWEIISQSNN